MESSSDDKFDQLVKLNQRLRDHSINIGMYLYKQYVVSGHDCFTSDEIIIKDTISSKQAGKFYEEVNKENLEIEYQITYDKGDMFEPIWNIYPGTLHFQNLSNLMLGISCKVGIIALGDNQSEAHTERMGDYDDNKSDMSDSKKTERKQYDSKTYYKGDIITHSKGEVLLVYFFSVLNKKSHPFITYLSEIYEKFSPDNRKFRIIGINYDPKDIFADEVIEGIHGSKILEFYSIDSGDLKNGHLEKYGLTILPKLLVVNKQGIIEHFGRPKDYDLEEKLPLIFVSEIILSDSYYNSNFDQDMFNKERDQFLIFMSRLLSNYIDTLNKFIEYKIEFGEKSFVSFKGAKAYLLNVSIYALKSCEDDVNYLLSNLDSYLTNGWCTLKTTIVLIESLSIKKGNHGSNGNKEIKNHQYICLEGKPNVYFCPECVTKNMKNFKKYHSNYFCRQMLHGHHALLLIDSNTGSEYLTKLLYSYRTKVDQIYFDEDNIEGTELQKSHLYDSGDFGSRLIKRVAWKCMNCRQITICDECHITNDPEDDEILNEHRIEHVYLRILDYQNVNMIEVKNRK